MLDSPDLMDGSAAPGEPGPEEEVGFYPIVTFSVQLDHFIPSFLSYSQYQFFFESDNRVSPQVRKASLSVRGKRATDRGLRGLA